MPIPTTERIDVSRLKKQEPIYLIDEIVLYEDELADNGISQLTVKFVHISLFFHHIIITHSFQTFLSITEIIQNQLRLGCVGDVLYTAGDANVLVCSSSLLVACGSRHLSHL